MDSLDSLDTGLANAELTEQASTIIALKNEISRLKRQLERERKARQSAESLLDDYAKKTYLANENLREAISNSNEKQAEIEFLVKCAQEQKNSNSRQTLIESLLGLCYEFTSASYATCLFSRDNKFQGNQLIQGRLEPCFGEIDLPSLFPTDIDTIIHSWCIQELSINDHVVSDGRTVWFVYSNFVFDQEHLGWIGLIIETPTIEEEMLFILDTHLAQLRMGLEKLNVDELAEQKFQRSTKLQEELTQVKKQLAIADRMSSLGELASGVAHEINNPLAFISANNKYLKQTLSDLFISLDELHKGSKLNEKAASILSSLANIKQNFNEVLQDNVEGIDRLSNISDSLRTFVYRGETEFSPVDLNDIVSHAFKVASYSKQKSHELQLKLFEGNAMISANRGEIEQVVLNIIINALHATTQGGDVLVTVGESSGQHFVSIRDSGVGISEENLEKIFSPFYTTKPVGEGTGLGLAISKNIIDAHNGTLDVESAVNVGTCFTINIPKVHVR